MIVQGREITHKDITVIDAIKGAFEGNPFIPA